MNMIRNALSMSFFPLDFGLLDPGTGSFAVAPDGGVRLHTTAPLGDIAPSSFSIKVPPRPAPWPAILPTLDKLMPHLGME
jgi:hypothetical protein